MEPTEFNRRILVVDDNPQISEEIARILGKAKLPTENASFSGVKVALFGKQDQSKAEHEFNYIIDSAFQGEEAVKLVRQAAENKTPYALVFIDMYMPPGIDGLEAIRKIWAVSPETEVVICSAHSDYSWKDIIGAVGINDRILVLKKPFDSIEIQQIALSLTVKWNIAKELRNQLADLESKVEERTLQLREQQSRMVNSEKMIALGMMAAGVAHEINNPLSYVAHSLEFAVEKLNMIQQKHSSPELTEVLSLLGETAAGIDRIHHVARDLKSFSRTHELEELGSVDVIAVIEAALRIASFEIQHRAKIIKSFSAVPAVLANEAKLGQVVLNLLINAAQAIPEGKMLENEIRITVASLPTGEVQFSVQDSGTGMTSDVMKNIFEPFFTTKPNGVGTGLGLPISKSVIESFKGKIEVESEVGVGSAFRVTLPSLLNQITSSPKPAAVSTSSSPMPKHAGRILVIDDEEAIARFVSQILKREHQVEICHSGREALQLLIQDSKFDVIFCDLTMADLNGMKLYEEVKNRIPDLEKRFVFLTGGAFTSQAQHFIENIKNTVLDKPVRSEVILKTAQSVIASFLQEDKNS